MKSIILRNSTAVWIGFCLTSMLASCGSQQLVRKQGEAQLPLGLFKVVKRECSYPSGIPEDCSQTQYIEVAKGGFGSLEKKEVGLVTWLSDNPRLEHTFNIRDLRQGKFVEARQYIIEDNPFGKEWFVVNNGTITDYFFIRHARQTAHGNMAGRTHLTLMRIARTREIDRLLQYPSDME